jgi:Caspase domain
MRWGRFTFIFSTFILFAVPALAADRVALVIGNGAYQRVPALPNPPRDAADIAHALERLDFKVTQLNNATASDMRKALVEFGRAAEGSMMAVVFYAGHGMEAGGENWLVPTDAELRSDTDIESEAVSLRSVNLQVSKARQLGLVILDACRNNPFAAKMKRSLSTRGVSRGLAPTEPTDNVLVAYAARDGTTANDGDGRNSPFTAALLRNIETPGLEISFLFRNVRDEVMLATKREQQPFVYGSLSKEAIYLKPPASPTSVIASTMTNAPAQVEQSPNNQKRDPVGGAEQNSYTPEDAQRVAARGAELNLKIPAFAIGDIKVNVPVSFRRYVGIWVSKAKIRKGRSRMLILTEAASDGLVLGHYVYGDATGSSWDSTPAGYINLTGKISDNTLRFNTAKYPAEVTLNEANTMTLRFTNLEGKISTTKLTPIWQLVPADHETSGKRPNDLDESTRAARKKTTVTSIPSDERKPDPSSTRDSSQSVQARYAKCSAEGHRLMGSKHKNVGFSRIEACVRNGGQM